MDDNTIPPKHIQEALFKRRNELICQLNEEGFKLKEIQFILSHQLTPQRINKIIIDSRSETEKSDQKGE